MQPLAPSYNRHRDFSLSLIYLEICMSGLKLLYHCMAPNDFFEWTSLAPSLRWVAAVGRRVPTWMASELK